MNTEDYLINLLISVGLTLIVTLVPYIIVRLITQKQIQLKTAKIFTVIFSIVTFAIFCIIFFLLGQSKVSIPPLIIWNIVGYFIIKPNNNDRKKTENTLSDDNFTNVPISTITADNQKNDETEANNIIKVKLKREQVVTEKPLKIKKTKKSNFKVSTIVLSIMTILFAASTIGLSIGLIDISNDNQKLSSQITDLENTVSSKDKEIAMYKEQISNLKSRLNNFVMSRNAENNGNRLTSEEIQSHTYYCTNNSSPYYHTSACPDCDRNGFTIWFDTDAVESAGYLPCPNCIEQ